MRTSTRLTRLLPLLFLADAVRGAVYTDASQLPATTFDFVIIGGVSV